MHRDIVTRSWGPLLCYSSAAITSCFIMIMHCRMSQGSVLNFWKLKMSQFFHGPHTHQICHPMSMSVMLWIDMYDSVFQFSPISSNFAQPLMSSETTFHRTQSTAWSTLCEGDVSRSTRQMAVTPDTDWFSDPRPYHVALIFLFSISIESWAINWNVGYFYVFKQLTDRCRFNYFNYILCSMHSFSTDKSNQAQTVRCSKGL